MNMIHKDLHLIAEQSEQRIEDRRNADRKAFGYGLERHPQYEAGHLLVLVNEWLMASLDADNRQRLVNCRVTELPQGAEDRMKQACQWVNGGFWMVVVVLTSMGHVFHEQNVCFCVPRLMRMVDVIRVLENSKLALQNACRELQLLEGGNDGFIRRDDSQTKVLTH